ncbi:MAG: hypothetical protein ACLPID_05090 [Beijerinckiaceae bacterium]
MSRIRGDLNFWRAAADKGPDCRMQGNRSALNGQPNLFAHERRLSANSRKFYLQKGNCCGILFVFPSGDISNLISIKALTSSGS